jgi:hypothetical protein
LSVDLIEEGADTQARVHLSQETIDEYALNIAEILKEHPIDVFSDVQSYYIGDGWHRFMAAAKAGLTVVPCTMHTGGEREARLFAAGANKGLRRTQSDKRRAVEIMLNDPEWCDWSDGKIADHCGVTQPFVSKVRAEFKTIMTSTHPEEESEMSDKPSPKRVLGRDGKSYPVKEKKSSTPTKAVADEATGPDVEALSLPYRESVNLLHSMRRKFEALAQTPEGVHLAPKIQRLSNEFDVVKGTIRQAEPLELCGKCKGEGCQHCGRTGFWTRATVESLKK